MKKSSHMGDRKVRSHSQQRLKQRRVPSRASSGTCQLVAVGKRRDGGTRYWCLEHKADATAKYGRPASKCRAADLPPIRPKDIFTLNIDKYKGGVALWGAVPAIYDTTTLPMYRGIHVHARIAAGDQKELDQTFRSVRVLSGRLPENGILISDMDAIYYMVSSIFGFGMKYVICTFCGYPHLDRDWFSIHPHRRHLCAGCGRHFRDTVTAIGNPILAVSHACGTTAQKPRTSQRKLDIKQSDFPGGIQIWGSNPAFVWTSDVAEEEGIHVHAFPRNGSCPDPDETFGEVSIDGVSLDPLMVRILMAQGVMPSLKNRVLPIDCPFCAKAQFDEGESAFTPVIKHICKQCGREFTGSGRLRKVIANPLPGILARLAQNAPRKPQQHDLKLMPETL